MHVYDICNFCYFCTPGVCSHVRIVKILEDDDYLINLDDVCKSAQPRQGLVNTIKTD